MTEQLICAECGCKADDEGRGWLAFFVDLPDDEDEAETIFFCATCSAAEFSQSAL